MKKTTTIQFSDAGRKAKQEKENTATTDPTDKPGKKYPRSRVWWKLFDTKPSASPASSTGSGGTDHDNQRPKIGSAIREVNGKFCLVDLHGPPALDIPPPLKIDRATRESRAANRHPFKGLDTRSGSSGYQQRSSAENGNLKAPQPAPSGTSSVYSIEQPAQVPVTQKHTGLRPFGILTGPDKAPDSDKYQGAYPDGDSRAGSAPQKGADSIGPSTASNNVSQMVEHTRLNTHDYVDCVTDVLPDPEVIKPAGSHEGGLLNRRVPTYGSCERLDGVNDVVEEWLDVTTGQGLPWAATPSSTNITNAPAKSAKLSTHPTGISPLGNDSDDDNLSIASFEVSNNAGNTTFSVIQLSDDNLILPQTDVAVDSPTISTFSQRIASGTLFPQFGSDGGDSNSDWHQYVSTMETPNGQNGRVGSWYSEETLWDVNSPPASFDKTSDPKLSSGSGTVHSSLNDVSEILREGSPVTAGSRATSRSQRRGRSRERHRSFDHPADDNRMSNPSCDAATQELIDKLSNDVKVARTKSSSFQTLLQRTSQRYVDAQNENMELKRQMSDLREHQQLLHQTLVSTTEEPPAPEDDKPKSWRFKLLTEENSRLGTQIKNLTVELAGREAEINILLEELNRARVYQQPATPVALNGGGNDSRAARKRSSRRTSGANIASGWRWLRNLLLTMAYTTKMTEQERMMLLKAEAEASGLKMSPVWDFSSSNDTGSSPRKRQTSPEAAEKCMLGSRFAPKPEAQPPQGNPQGKPSKKAQPDHDKREEQNIQSGGQEVLNKRQRQRRNRQARLAAEAAAAAQSVTTNIAAKAKKKDTPAPAKAKAAVNTSNQPKTGPQAATTKATKATGVGNFGGFTRPPPTEPRSMRPGGGLGTANPNAHSAVGFGGSFGGGFGAQNAGPQHGGPGTFAFGGGLTQSTATTGNTGFGGGFGTTAKAVPPAFSNNQTAPPPAFGDKPVAQIGLGASSFNPFADNKKASGIPRQSGVSFSIGPNNPAFNIGSTFALPPKQTGGLKDSIHSFNNHGGFGNSAVPAFGQTTALGAPPQVGQFGAGFGSSANKPFDSQGFGRFSTYTSGGFGNQTASGSGISQGIKAANNQESAGSQPTSKFSFQNSSGGFGNASTPAFGNSQNTVFTANDAGIFGAPQTGGLGMQTPIELTPPIQTPFGSPPVVFNPFLPNTEKDDSDTELLIDLETTTAEPMPPPLLFSIGGRSFTADINKILNGPQRNILDSDPPTPIQKPIVGSATSLAGPGHDYTIKNLENAVREALGRRNYSSSDSSGDSPGFMIRNLMTEEGFQKAWESTVGTEKERLQQMFRILVESDFRRQKAYVRGQIDETDVYIANMDPRERVAIERERLARRRKDNQEKQDRKKLINAEEEYKDNLRRKLQREVGFVGREADLAKPKQTGLQSIHAPSAAAMPIRKTAPEPLQPQKITSALAGHNLGPVKGFGTGFQASTSSGFGPAPATPAAKEQPSALAASRWATAAPKPAVVSKPAPKAGAPSQLAPMSDVETQYLQLRSRALRLGHLADAQITSHNDIAGQGKHSAQCDPSFCAIMEAVVELEMERTRITTEADSLQKMYAIGGSGIMGLGRLNLNGENEGGL
ncbi:hypothetical protein TWF696_005612 [Orbilia brochopaga]|uniref:Uncharacterized protein n=1 Tax=Orbilia brochopaga TaxID=3140254 RepID=A0AAV9V3K9_9PEZI